MPFLDFGTRFARDICLYRLRGFKGSVERTLPLAARGICPSSATRFLYLAGQWTSVELPWKQNNTMGPNNPLLVGDPPPRLPCEA